jgi:hypothetical protein
MSLPYNFMDFNFYDQFKDYSNIELLKMIKQLGAYQATTIEAATQILKDRQILASETEMVDLYFQNIEVHERTRLALK